MSKFNKITEARAGSKIILQGNAAFALGVVHAGYHAADGYPGTPSTEVIDKSLAFVQDKIQVGWSVSEAVAVAVGVGHAIAGFDTVVTMKIPGVFQAGDSISSAAFYNSDAGALVFFVASDYIPSSTQHVIDPRYFFSSLRLPVLEPLNHQEMYEVAFTAADISRKFNTPVVVLASGSLTHSEGLVVSGEPRKIQPRELPPNLREWMCMPNFARKNYDFVSANRIPSVEKWSLTTNLAKEMEGNEDWGVITCGINDIICKEAFQSAGLNPPMLSLGLTYPVPSETIKNFASKIKGKLFVIEDGYRFLWERIKLLGIDAIDKEETSNITDWTPGKVLEFLSGHLDFPYQSESKQIDISPVPRPPGICPGCSYRALALAIQKLKRKKKIYASFGDIGCSTLLYFFNALDTVLCMGASDSLRQGFVMSRPEMAGNVISIIGDSTECHSGLDSTRNAVFRNVPGVKIILDNRITAMTGGQVAPSSETNLAHQEHKFDLVRAIEAEGGRTVVVDGYNYEQVESELKKALELAGEGTYTTMVVEGPCIHQVDNDKTVRHVDFDYEECVNCGLCNVCTGIELDENKKPSFTVLCTDCGEGEQVCMQVCPIDHAIFETGDKERKPISLPPELKEIVSADVSVSKEILPETLRVAVRGIGGQGNLFFGKALSEVALRTPYIDTHIVKGDTHGMAQLGGPVISVFSCGKVYSPILAPHSVDVLVAMEINEILRPEFLDLLKSGGTIILNEFKALPPNTKKAEYPKFDKIKHNLDGYNVINTDLYKAAEEIGDKKGRSANVIALGLLSKIEPFSLIPKEIWINSILSISPNDFAKSANYTAFSKGRGLIEL